jgi:hypothetical protein
MRTTAIVMALLLATLLVGCGSGDEDGTPVVEEKVKTVLKAMSDKLASASRMRFEVERTMDAGLLEGRAAGGTVRGEVFLERPDKLAAAITTEGARRAFLYDGSRVTIADLEAGCYASVEAPPTVDEMLAMLEEDYGYEPPVASFLRSDPYRHLLIQLVSGERELKSGKHAGMEEIRGLRTHHLVFHESYVDWELWIAEDTSLPVRMLVTATAMEGKPKLSVDILKVEIVETLAAETFVFVAPDGAVEIDMVKVERAEAE